MQYSIDIDRFSHEPLLGGDDQWESDAKGWAKAIFAHGDLAAEEVAGADALAEVIPAGPSTATAPWALRAYSRECMRLAVTAAGRKGGLEDSEAHAVSDLIRIADLAARLAAEVDARRIVQSGRTDAKIAASRREPSRGRDRFRI